MEAPITITHRELLLLSPEVRSQVREVTTTRRVPNEPQPNVHSFTEIERKDDIKVI